MAGISVTAELQDRSGRERLDEVLGRLSELRPFFQSVGELLQASTKDRFRQETAPDGTPWTPLKPATVRARKRRGKSQIAILRESGHLAGSNRTEVSGTGVEIGSPVEYAAIHQLGGTINIPARQGTVRLARKRKGVAGRRFAKKTSKTAEVRNVSIPGYSVTIPARPYFGLTATNEADILDMAEDWLNR